MPEATLVLSYISRVVVTLSIALLFVALFAMAEENEDSKVKWRIAMPAIALLLPALFVAGMVGVYNMQWYDTLGLTYVDENTGVKYWPNAYA